MAMAAHGPVSWSDPDEAAFKREQCWGHGQLEAGYQYLIRKSQGDKS
jgi:hypothetical protein